WLKDVHGVPQNSQWAIAFAAAEAAGWERPSTQEYADTLYSGTKASLRPLHDAVVRLALDQGEDAEAQGRGTYIPVVRKSQFAAVAPGPRGTLRVGLRYRGSVPGEPRLEPAKGFAQATHWGSAPVVMTATLLLTIGSAMRLAGSNVFVLYAATLVVGIGIAVVGTLLPRLVKTLFPPERVGLVTGVYMLAIMVGATIGAGMSEPLAAALGSWEESLA